MISFVSFKHTQEEVRNWNTQYTENPHTLSGTCTEIQSSNRHTSQKFDVIETLPERAIRICEPEALDTEIKYLIGNGLANNF